MMGLYIYRIFQEYKRMKTKDELLEEFMSVHGWLPYCDSWIRQEWIENNDPYDRMAATF